MSSSAAPLWHGGPLDFALAPPATSLGCLSLKLSVPLVATSRPLALPPASRVINHSFILSCSEPNWIVLDFKVKAWRANTLWAGRPPPQSVLFAQTKRHTQLLDRGSGERMIRIAEQMRQQIQGKHLSRNRAGCLPG